MSAKKKSSWFVSDFDDLGDDRSMGLIDVSKRGGNGSGSIEGHSNMKRSNSGGIAEHPLSSNKSKRPTEGSSSSNFYRGASLDDELFKRKKRVVDDHEMWSVKHQPRSVTDLATHPKKTEEVRHWLKLSTSSSTSPKALLISGPAGAAKTATLTVLCRELKIEIQEWHNPNVNHFEEGVPYESVTDAFKRFIARAVRYRALTTASGESRKLVLIEELPGCVLKDPTLLHQVLEKFRPGAAPWPLVIIHSERHRSDTIKKLFPPQILSKMSHITFNQVASTNLVKSLSAIAMIESSYGSHSFKIPDKSEMTSLAAKVNGDIRAAINALQFNCLQQEGVSSASSFSSARKKPTKMVTGVGDKDSCFDLFHAMGKILYCKRHHDRPLENTRAIADRSKARRPLQSDPIEVLEKSPMSADSFTCFLHQNCLEFFPDIHSVSEAAEYLSKADPLFNEWTGSGKVDLTEYGGLMGTMGLCYPRTQPVKVGGGALKTFSKPEHYSAVSKLRERTPLLSHPFLDRRLSNAEIATSLAPFFAKTFKLAEETPAFYEAVSFYPRLGGKRVTVTPLARIEDGDVIQEEEIDFDELEYEDFLIEEF